MNATEFLECGKMFEDERVVALLEEIERIRTEAGAAACGRCRRNPCRCSSGRACGKCRSSPCECRARATSSQCTSCGSNPCTCHERTACKCKCSPCKCSSTTSACGRCGTHPCRCLEGYCGPGPNIADYLLELARLNMCFHEQLFEVNRRFQRQLFGGVCSPCVPDPCSASLSLDMSAVVGSVAWTKFQVDNQSSADQELTFLWSPLRGKIPPEPVVYEPRLYRLSSTGERLGGMVVARGQSATVLLGISVPAEKFEPGQTYSGEISVRGAETLELKIRLTVLAEGQQVADAGAADAGSAHAHGHAGDVLGPHAPGSETTGPADHGDIRDLGRGLSNPDE